MVAPTRYPAGISTFKPASILSDFPAVSSPSQVSMENDFLPYQSGLFTFTSTTSTAVALPWSGGGVTLNSAAASSKAYLSLTGNNATGFNMQFVPGNRMWYHATCAFSTGVIAANPSVLIGWFDTVDPTAATNGIWITKPTASAGPCNLVILKSGVTTTITNVCDISKPSGIYGDTSSSVATLSFPTAATWATPSITTAGGGYNSNPLVTPTNVSGSGAKVYAVEGSGSIQNVIVAAPGSGYTGALTTEVNHFLDFGFVFDGNGTFTFGINGRKVLSIGNTASPQNALVVGSSQTMQSFSSNSIYVPATTLLTGSTMVVPPGAGNFLNMAPLTTMTAGLGFSSGTLATTASMFIDTVAIATDSN